MARRQHKKKKPIPAVRMGEMATPERYNQLGGLITEVMDRDATGKASISHHRARIECILDYYHKAFVIDDQQYMAALKFREIYLRVNFGYNTKTLCQPFLIEAGRPDPEWKMLAHIDCLRHLRGVYVLLSSAQQNILRNVCGHDEYVKTNARKKTFLRGLNILVAHWGYDRRTSK